jgi:hypothetical protein
VSEKEMGRYSRQSGCEFVEYVAMDLVDFFKVFGKWHCGLNQLAKLFPVPFS